MKNFPAVFDEYKFSKSTLDYAIQLTQPVGTRLLDIFLNDPIYCSYDAAYNHR